MVPQGEVLSPHSSWVPASFWSSGYYLGVSSLHPWGFLLVLCVQFPVSKNMLGRSVCPKIWRHLRGNLWWSDISFKGVFLWTSGPTIIQTKIRTGVVVQLRNFSMFWTGKPLNLCTGQELGNLWFPSNWLETDMSVRLIWYFLGQKIPQGLVLQGVYSSCVGFFTSHLVQTLLKGKALL